MNWDRWYDLGIDRPNNKISKEEAINVLEMLIGCKTCKRCTGECEICMYGQYSNKELVNSLNLAIQTLKK